MHLLNLFAGVDERSLFDLMSQTQALISLCLRGTHVVDDALYHFPGSSLEILDISNTMVSAQSYEIWCSLSRNMHTTM